MENATKALLIAAGILFGLMIISLSLVMRNNVSNYYENQKNENIRKEIATFNGQYLIYQKDDLRGNDLLSLINKVLDFNKGKADEEPEMEISIFIDDSPEAKNGFYKDEDDPKILQLNTTYVHKVGVAGTTDIKVFLDAVRDLESGNQKKILETLSANISTLIIDEGLTPQKKAVAEQKRTELLQRVGKKNIGTTELNRLIDDTLKYYQYQQFRRAHFNCQATNYTDTGRVRRFEVTFADKFE